MYDIEQFVLHQFYDYKYYGNPPTDIQVDCPFCEDRGAGADYKNHLHISINKSVVHCFRCEYARSWIGFVIDLTGLPYHQALGELYHPARIRGDVKEHIARRLSKNQTVYDVDEFNLPDDFQLLEKSKNRLGRVAKQYLVKRGFDASDWNYYQLGVAPSMGYRVIIPIEDDYWQGRRLYKNMVPKYKNPSDPARNVIFNYAALDMYDEIVVCEGAFSAMAVGGNSVAILAKKATKEKTSRLLDAKANKFIIALEPGAFTSMQELADALYRNGKEVVIWKYDSGDPADGSPFVELGYDLKSKIYCRLNS